jgi:hypothetical protein
MRQPQDNSMKLETIQKRLAQAEPGKTIGPYEIDIRQIRQDPTFQVRKKLNEANLSRIRAAYRSGAEVQPITLAYLDEAGPDQLPVIIDGHHRVTVLEALAAEAAVRGGPSYNTVQAHFTRLETTEARWQAARANGAHGEPLKGSEYRALFRRFVEANHHRLPDGSYKSYREISREIGRTHPTIMKWMHLDFPKEARRMGSEEQSGKEGGQGAPAPLVLVKHKARAALSEIINAHEQMSYYERQEIIDWLWASLDDMERVQSRTDAFTDDMALVDLVSGVDF